MYNYRDQLEMLDGIRVRENETKRIDCPFCGGKKTFGIARRDGKLMWNCFKASCAVRGVRDSEMSVETARRRMDGLKADRTRRSVEIPALLSDPDNHPKALRYLEQVNSLEAFRRDLVRVTYSPGEDRVLFHTKDRLGAVGRSLCGEKPKWKVYGEVSGLFEVGEGSTAVLVEDIASACSAARVDGVVGCALMGTNLSALQRTQLRRFERVIIALDPDASRKALDLHTQLCASVRCFVVTLADDLKWLDGPRVAETLKLETTHVLRAGEDNSVNNNQERTEHESARTYIDRL